MNVFIFGAGYEYDRLSAVLSLYKDKIVVKGIILTKSKENRMIDGYPVYRFDQVDFTQVDYILLAVADWKPVFSMLKQYISPEKIIRSSVLFTPNFNLDDYLRLKESNCSILSNYCLGGMISAYLALPFLSPTVNMYCGGIHPVFVRL